MLVAVLISSEVHSLGSGGLKGYSGVDISSVQGTYLEKNDVGTMPCHKYSTSVRAVACLGIGVLVRILPWNVGESVNACETRKSDRFLRKN